MAVKKHTGGPKLKSQTDKERVLAEVQKWSIQGLNQREIAEKLVLIGVNVSQPMVGVYLKQINERYKEATLGDRRQAVMEKLAEYKLIRTEAYEAWHKSKEDYFKRVKEEGTAGEGSFSKEKEEEGGRLAGAQYLQIVLDCIKAERELLGLDEAMKVDVDVVHTAIPWDQLVGHRNEVDLVEAEIQKVEKLAITQGG